jgi:hypothetical protein
MNPYKILGISDQATDEEVRRAYRAMAAKYHPDAGGDAWVFAQVREAYDRILHLRQIAVSSPQQTPLATATSPQPQPGRQATAYSTGAYSTSQQTGDQASQQSIGKRIVTLLFHHQLPLQSETSFFILANVLDIVFTNVLLRMDAIEANPIARQIFINWGFHGMIAFKLFLVAFVCLITQLIAVHHLRRARQTLYLGTAIVGAVVAYSAYLLARSH